jgi:general secretion pathway protein I
VAGLQATAALTTNAARQSDMLLAQVCAENELTRIRLLRQLPGVGETTAPCQQGTQAFDVLLAVAPTPNPNFRRVDAQVLQGGQPMLRLSTIVGRL